MPIIFGMIKNLAHYFICLVLGVVLSFSQAPYHLWFLIFPVFSGFYYIFTKMDTKRGVFLASFLFAIGYFVTGLNWIGNALLVEGNEYRWVWPLAVIALPTLLSVFTALFMTVAHIISHKKHALGFLAFCSALALSEFTRGYIFTGFPWNLFGYTWLGLMSIAQFVSVIGPYGLTFLTIFWGASLGYLYIHKKQAFLMSSISILIFAVVFTYGFLRISHNVVEFNEDVQIRIVQPNIAQAEKWKPSRLADNFETHLMLSEGKNNDKKTIIVWPETAIPPSLIYSLTAKERFKNLLNDQTILLAGGLSITSAAESKQREYHNALFLMDSINPPDRVYNKSHLVPFGEYIPFQEYLTFIKPVVDFAGFNQGRGATTINIEGFPSFSPQICYEIIFPNRAINKKQNRPDYILTVTNDAWYGDSAGPRQHFSIARFRAIEQGLPVIRSANTGISGVIDPWGRIIDKIPLLESGNIESLLPNPLAETTLYSRFGDIFFYFTCLFWLFFAFFHRKM